MVRVSSEATRGLNDYLAWLEAEYDIHIEARDLSGSIRENLNGYQEEFDAMVLGFYGAVDEIEKTAFDACSAIEEGNEADKDEMVDELLADTRGKICEEGGKLARRLNSLNVQFS